MGGVEGMKPRPWGAQAPGAGIMHSPPTTCQGITGHPYAPPAAAEWVSKPSPGATLGKELGEAAPSPSGSHVVVVAFDIAKCRKEK